MTRPQKNQLLCLVESFFHDHLQRMRGASPHTVRAYRDSLRLLFNFLADAKGCSVADLQLNDLHVNSVAAFLAKMESKRGNMAATRNCRLAAIRSFVSISFDTTSSTLINIIESWHYPRRKPRCPLLHILSRRMFD